MILSAAVALFASGLGVTAIQHSADIYYHSKKSVGPSMWVFNKDGLTVYSPDGDVLRAHRKAQICPNQRLDTRSGQPTSDCSFFDVQSDGHQFVWAANHDDEPHRVNVFDIDTADFAGYVETCSTPLDLNYHPARREMWVRCAATGDDPDAVGEVDVFSTSSLSSDHNLVSFNVTAGMRAYGRMQAHSGTLGNVAYATQYNRPHLTKFDLSDKEVLGTYNVEGGYATYDMAYAPHNEHVFAAVRVCCTCESEGADLEECPAARGGGSPTSPVLVQTGPNAREGLQEGVCSAPCKGSPADTIGVVEFDTVAEKFVTSHNTAAGNGCIPITSPDGRTILLLPFDGGKTVRVLEAGGNGVSSSIAADVQVDFQGGNPNTQVVSDAAFVEHDGNNIIVIAGSTDNDVVLVDANDGHRTKKISLSTNAEPTAAGSNRQVEWAVGTNYVWINGGQTEEVYIIDVGGGIDDARVVRTLTDVPDGKVVFVQNYAAAADEITLSAVRAEVYDQEEAVDSSRTIGLAALIIGCINLVGLVVVGLLARSGARGDAPASAPAAAASPGGVETASQSGDVTLGSKSMN